MDYNFIIPDIYNQDNTKSDLFDIEIKKYYLKPHENKTIILPLNIQFLYFETENTNIFFVNSIIWNKKVLFFNSTMFTITNLTNNSDNDAVVCIYSILNKTIKINKVIKLIQCKIYNQFIKLIDLTEYNKSVFPIFILEKNLSLITLYCGIKILYQHYIKTNIKIIDKIIKLNSFNINVYYKIKLLHEKYDSYTYNLILCGIKNTLTDEYIDLDLNYNNLYEIYPKYLQMLKDLKIFMHNNLLYIKSNNIALPEDIKDPDGWEHNAFYYINFNNFIKKYNIQYCESSLIMVS
jgi:hypothetical protein